MTPEQEAREMLAKLLFVWGERAGGNADFSVDSDSVRYWFAQQSEARGEDAFCFSHCEELRAQADFLIRNFAAFAARPTAGIDRATLARAMNPALFDADPVVAHQAASPIIVEVAQRRAMTVAGEVLERLALPTAAKTGERGAKECQSVWRCAIGDVTSALDILKNKWAGSKRKAERDAGAVLAGVCDLIWAARSPAPSDYNEANEQGKLMIGRVRALSQPLPDAPIVGGEG